ncbi:hypothetical protein AAG906_033733 [Vitis piasezkii]
MTGGYRPYLLPNRPHLSPLPLSSLLRLSSQSPTILSSSSPQPTTLSLRSEALQLFGKFHSKDSIVANAKFFILILKKGGAEDIKDFRSLPDKFVAFSSFLGFPVTGFEKESNSLLWMLESRKGRGVKITRGKKNSPLATQLEREIRKLECSSVLPLFEAALPLCSLVVGVGVQMVSRASYVLCYSLGVCFGVGGAFSNGLSR